MIWSLWIVFFHMKRKMRRTINRGWVEVRLCHLMLHSDGSHEWEMIEA